MNSELAPLAVFVYKRPEHTKRMLSALAESTLIDKSIVYIFCDGEKTGISEEEKKSIAEVRQLCKDFAKQFSAKIIIHEKNMGVDPAIVWGINEVFKKHNKIIVIEDDIIVAKGFLKYMNDSLNQFESSKNVFHISGYTPSMDLKSYSKDYFLLHVIQVWGWATWKDRWDKYREEIDNEFNIISSSEKAKRKYNFHPAIGYYNMLKDIRNKKATIWDGKWYSTIFINKGLILFPFKSLSNNIGHDSTGEHCSTDGATMFVPNLFEITNDYNSGHLPKTIEEDKYLRRKMQNYLSKKLGRRFYYKSLLTNLFIEK
jgi:hypothetical protein